MRKTCMIGKGKVRTKIAEMKIFRFVLDNKELLWMTVRLRSKD